MKNERGVSLIESLMVLVFAGIIVSLLANLPNALGLIGKSRHVGIAREIAAKQIEDKRATSYINLVNGTNSISDSRLNLLQEGAGEVVISDCDVSICTNSEPVKLIEVKVSWSSNNKSQEVKLQTFIGEGGLNQ